MTCSTQHRVPLNLFDDPCVQWKTGYKCSNDTLRREIVKVYDELRTAVMKSLKKISILNASDGLTITVNKKSTYVLLYFKSNPDGSLFSGKAW